MKGFVVYDSRKPEGGDFEVVWCVTMEDGSKKHITLTAHANMDEEHRQITITPCDSDHLNLLPPWVVKKVEELEITPADGNPP
jgi:hypothetical protein